jgi:AI-2E family transporter
VQDSADVQLVGHLAEGDHLLMRVPRCGREASPQGSPRPSPIPGGAKAVLAESAALTAGRVRCPATRQRGVGLQTLRVLAQGAIQSIIQPKIMADAVNLSLTLTFLSLIFWAFVIGPRGAVLAVPLTPLTKALPLDGTRTPGGYPASSPAAPPRQRMRSPMPHRRRYPTESRDGDGPRPPAVERVTDIG